MNSYCSFYSVYVLFSIDKRRNEKYFDYNSNKYKNISLDSYVEDNNDYLSIKIIVLNNIYLYSFIAISKKRKKLKLIFKIYNIYLKYYKILKTCNIINF